MRNKKRVLIKYTALMLILLSALLLSACRTRITNNNEVSNIYNDEEGFLSETYEMRRSELGLSTAKKPILPDFGSGEEEEDFDTGESFEYEPEEEQYVEPPEAQNANTTTTNRTTSRTTTRRLSSGSSTSSSSTTKYTVTFYGNGGEPKEQNIQFRKGYKLRFPTTTPSREGYEFDGWWTDPNNGSKVDTGVEVKSSRKLYAHWKEKTKPKPKPTPKERYVVTFDPNGGTWEDGTTGQKQSPEIEEGKDATAPGKLTRKYYEFAGWDQSLKKIKESFVTKAIWNEKKGESLWNEKFSDAVDSSDYVLYDVLDGDGTVLQDCNAKIIKDGEEPQIAVIFSDSTNADVIKVLNNQLMTEYPSESYPGVRRYIISNPKGGSKKELLYKINLFDCIHDTEELPISDAERDLELNSGDVITITPVTNVIE